MYVEKRQTGLPSLVYFTDPRPASPTYEECGFKSLPPIRFRWPVLQILGQVPNVVTNIVPRPLALGIPFGSWTNGVDRELILGHPVCPDLERETLKA